MSRIVLTEEFVRRGVSITLPHYHDNDPYFFRERFSSIDVGATVNQKSAAPGPGRVVTVENDGSFVIASDGLVLAPQVTPVWGDQSVAASFGVHRLAAPIVIGRMSLVGGLCEVGFYSATTLTDANRIHTVSLDLATFLLKNKNGKAIVSINDIENASDCRIGIAALPDGGGAYYLRMPNIPWLLVGIEKAGTDAILYGGVSNYTGTGRLTDFSVATTRGAPRPFQSVASPSKTIQYGEGVPFIADVEVALNGGWDNGHYAEFRLKIDGTTNYVSVRLFNDGGTTKFQAFYNNGADVAVGNVTSTTLTAGSLCHIQLLSFCDKSFWIRRSSDSGVWEQSDFVDWTNSIDSDVNGYFTLEGSATANFSFLDIYNIFDQSIPDWL